MAISLVGVTTGTGSTSASDTDVVPLTLPTGTQGGDLLVLTGSSLPGNIASDTIVFSDVAGTTVQSGAYDTFASAAVIIRFAKGKKGVNTTDSLSIAYVTNGTGISGRQYAWTLAAYRGVDLNTPQDATSTLKTNTSSANLTNTGLTTVTDGAVVVVAAVMDAATAGTATAASGLTLQGEAERNGSQAAHFDLTKTTHGATGTLTPTYSTAVVSAVVTLALRPQATTTPYFESAGAAVNGTAGITPGLPTIYGDNSIFLLFVEHANETSLTAPTGWVEVTNSPQGTGTAAGVAATKLQVFWKRVSGTQTAPSVADAGDHTDAYILSYGGCVTSGNPWDITAGAVAAAATTAVSFPSVTTTAANDLIVLAVANATDTTTAQLGAVTNAALGTKTERADTNTTAGNGGGIAVVDAVKATAGSTGASTATLATSSVQALMTIALQVASGSILTDPAPSDSASAADAMVFNLSHVLADTATLSDTGSEDAVSTSFADSVTPSDSLSAGISLTDPAPSDSVTTTDALVMAFSYVLADNATPSEAQVFADSVALADSVTPSEARVSAYSQVLADSATPSDGLTSGTTVTLSLGDSVTPSDTLVNAPAPAFGDSVTATDSGIVVGFGKTLADNATPTEALVNAYSQGLADSATPSDSAVTAYGVGLALGDSVTPTEALGGFQVSKALADSVTPSEAQAFADSIGLGDSVTPSDSLTPGALGQNYFDSVTTTDAMVFNLSHVLADTATLSDTGSEDAVSTSFADSVTTSDSVIAGKSLALGDSVTPADALGGFQVAQALSDAVTPSEGQAKAISTQLADSATPADASLNQPGRAFADSVTASDAPPVTDLQVHQTLTPTFAEAVAAVDNVAINWLRKGMHASVVLDRAIWAPPRIGRPQISARLTTGRLLTGTILDSFMVGDTLIPFLSNKGFSDSAAPTDAMAFNLSYHLADAVSLGDGVPLLNVFPPKPNDPVNVSDTLVFSFNHALADSVTLTEAIANNPKPVFADSVTMADSNSAQQAAFILENHYQYSTQSQFVSWAGAAVGDVVIIHAVDNATPPSLGGAWHETIYSWASYGYSDYVAWKALNTADIAAGGVTLDQGAASFLYPYGASLYVYRNCSTVSVKSTTQGPSGSPLVLPGLTKAAGSLGIVTLVQDRQTGQTYAPPAGFTPRLSSYSSTYFTIGAADITPVSYTNGASIIWSDTGGGYDQVGWVLELT